LWFIALDLHENLADVLNTQAAGNINLLVWTTWVVENNTKVFGCPSDGSNVLLNILNLSNNALSLSNACYIYETGSLTCLRGLV